MRKKQLFSLFLKKLANGKAIYYYTCYDETGKRRQFSTGEADQQKAYAECYKRLGEGKLVRKSKLYFNEYTSEWFTHDKCPYYTVREAKGKTFSKSNIDQKRLTLKKHLLPVFGELRLDHLTTIHIESFLQSKKAEGYAVNTINSLLSMLSLILGEAVRTGVIDRNPCTSVIKYAKPKSEKGILSDEEVGRLFDRSRIDEIWGNNMHFLINFTAVSTGCRVAEILALTRDKINDGYLEISSSYDRKYGIKSTKSGETRYVPISDSLQEELIKYSESNSGRFIFSAKNPMKPVTYATVNKKFKSVLEKIGITEDERKSRGLTFHSYRHYANTRLRESGLSDAIIRKIIGHKTPSMTERYSHIDTRTIKFSDLKVSV